MSNILVDQLTGKTTDTTIDVFAGHAADSTTRTNLEQGLAKMWCRVTYSGGTPIDSDSLNVSSLDDDGTGDVDYNFASPSNSLSCSTVATSASSATSTLFAAVESTANARTLQYNSSGNPVDHNSSVSMHGDLA